MGTKDDIHGRVKDLLAPGSYDITDSKEIPGPGDNRLTFGNKGVRFEAATLYIDMRGSTAVLNAHNDYTVAKIHKAYLYTATTLIADHGGQIRSYNGDSILAFFTGTKQQAISKAIKAAMQVKYMLAIVCKAEFDRYHELDFGIGIDHGKVLCVKAGKAQNKNHNDLIWLGNAVNRAAVLGDEASGPAHIRISQLCRDNLASDVKTSSGRDMWTRQAFDYNGNEEATWKTTFRWKVP